MELTPSEHDRLLIFTAAQLAESRRARGLKLNKPEAVALISSAIIEAARDGKSHAQALDAGLTAVSADDLLPGVAAMLSGIAVEGVFDDGRRLVVVPKIASNDSVIPGEVVRLGATDMVGSESDLVTVRVSNESAIQISVTSHMHFFEVNPRLKFDRAAAYGRHLYIPAGEHVDFPSQGSVEVTLAPIKGDRVVIGFAGLVDGPLDAPGMKERALERLHECGYLNES